MASPTLDIKSQVTRDKVSQAFFLALIEAVRNPNCNCDTCKILRKVFELMKAEFLTP